MFDQMLEGVQLIDAEFRYRYVNETAARHGQRSRDELIGRRMTDLFPGIDRTEMFGRLETCLRERTPQRMSNEFTYPDGRVGWFDLHMAPVPTGVLVLSIDVTSAHHATKELRRSVQALEEADRRKSEFLTMLAHELRNPLAPLQNGLHILRAAQSTATNGDQTESVIAMMERQVRLLSRFVEDLIDVNRLGHGKLTVALERVDLARIVRNAASDHRVEFERKHITLGVELPEIPMWMNGDRARLAQVFANVLDNACMFTPAGGDVLVHLAADAGDVAVVTVRDTGIGIDADVLPLVFDPLFQADTTMERTRGGLGLGLSVARGLVELHGGSINAASDGLDRGTTIRIALPRQGESAAVTTTSMGAPATPAARRVLVIDDNRDAAKTLGMILEFWGYRVRLAYSGPDGVDDALATQPDIVVSDIGLPGMDGYAVARTLRNDDRTQRARLIAITGYGHGDDRDRALRAGFDMHLAKPVDPDLLRAQLEAPLAAR